MSAPRSYQQAVTAAMDQGIAAALKPTGWAVFCATARSLPNIRPTRATIAERAGVDVSTVSRHLRRMVKAELFKSIPRYGESGEQLPSLYELLDITDLNTAKSIINWLNGVGTTAKGEDRPKGLGGVGTEVTTPLAPVTHESSNESSKQACKGAAAVCVSDGYEDF